MIDPIEPRAIADDLFNILVHSGFEIEDVDYECGRLLYRLGATELSCRNARERQGWITAYFIGKLAKNQLNALTTPELAKQLSR